MAKITPEIKTRRKRAIVRNRGSSPPRQHGFNSRAGHHDHGYEIIGISKTIRPPDNQLDLVFGSFNAGVRKAYVWQWREGSEK